MDKQTLTGLVAFILACMFLAFLGGVFTSIFKLFPFPALESLVSQIATELKTEPGKGDKNFLYEARNNDSGVTVSKRDQMQPGITLVTGMWQENDEWRTKIRLLTPDGEVLHQWNIYPETLWPELPFNDWVKGSLSSPSAYVHGTALLPDGDIIFNIEYLGAFRMNACSELQWGIPLRLHHSIDEDEDGNFWASGLHWREQPIKEYPHLSPPFVEETMVQFTPEGEVLREISILKALYNSGYQGAVSSFKRKFDITHMNDVEVLSSEMADQFPTFNAGDIMVSLRNYNMVVVVDGVTEQIKWHFWHPLIRQHDPDFEADGHIVIFNNNDDTTRSGELWGQTQLLRVDPVSGDYERIYPVNDDDYFYTKEGGKHQLLDNGNRLIVEANAGRVVEVNASGETVWNWVIDAREGNYIPEVLEGTRYPAAAAEFVNGLSCP